jgi:hypothetical protein
VNNELERMWKEEVVALFQHFLGGTDENHEKLRITGLQANRAMRVKN